jgi:vacuolar-type H+-ATPase catalytic subunit A/Vma1
MEKIEALKEDRQNIILQMQQEKANNNDKEILKTLKNKYHSLSNKINYLNNHDKIKEHKKYLNKTYETPESVNREELQQLLQSQSNSTLTMGLVGSIAEDEVESVYLVNLTSGLKADPLNKEIQDRVKQVMNAEEVSPPKRRRDAEDVSPSTKRRRDAEKTSVIGSSRKLRSEL